MAEELEAHGVELLLGESAEAFAASPRAWRSA